MKNFIALALYRGNNMDTYMNRKIQGCTFSTNTNFPFLQSIIFINMTWIWFLLDYESILYLPIKAWRFPFPLSFDYFNEPCTTAVVKKTGTPCFCTLTWLMVFVFFFVSWIIFWKRKKSTNFIRVFKYLASIFFRFGNKGFGCYYLHAYTLLPCNGCRSDHVKGALQAYLKQRIQRPSVFFAQTLKKNSIFFF